jgi:transposase-like protein
MPRKRRLFSAEVKARAVLDVLSGDQSAAEVCRRLQINATLFSQWKAIVLERLPVVFDADASSGPDAQRVAELEQLLGRQAYELEVLKKASKLLHGLSPKNGRSS